VDKGEKAGSVHHEERRHPAQLDQIPFLPIKLPHNAVGVWNTGKRQLFLLPVGSHLFGTVGGDDHKARFSPGKPVVIRFHPAQMLAGIGSAEAPQEHKNHGALLSQSRQADLLAIEGDGVEFRSHFTPDEGG
jgi:hypothetical protein